MNGMKVGSRLEDASVPVELLPHKFNRHTFWCGQSGSGKTYALGVVLEQLLLNTELPVLILDPNADFVRLPETRDEAESEAAAQLASQQIRVLHSANKDDAQLRTSFLELSSRSKAAVLQLDPIADPEEYNALLHADADPGHFDNADFLAKLRAHPGVGHQRLANRIDNLQVLDWELWARGGETATAVVAERPRATVLDLGGFSHRDEPKVAALSVLEQLWERRAERRPILIVIDEAHNLCSPTPGTLVESALTEVLMQIAAEGRKFGLWLLLSSQRPTKIHPNVLSQCDNLCLMRMNAPRDLAEIAEVFGFVPDAFLQRAQSFLQGQALFAGGFIAEPTITQMGARLTEEGGADVPVPLRNRQAPKEGKTGRGGR